MWSDRRFPFERFREALEIDEACQVMDLEAMADVSTAEGSDDGWGKMSDQHDRINEDEMNTKRLSSHFTLQTKKVRQTSGPTKETVVQT